MFNIGDRVLVGENFLSDEFVGMKGTVTGNDGVLIDVNLDNYRKPRYSEGADWPFMFTEISKIEEEN